jgi:hypothetical protein
VILTDAKLTVIALLCLPHISHVEFFLDVWKACLLYSFGNFEPPPVSKKAKASLIYIPRYTVVVAQVARVAEN